MLDNNTAPLSKKHRSSPRRGVRSGSDGYPRATLNSVGPNYSLFDDFNYEEPLAYYAITHKPGIVGSK